jgi:hypothetical protein
VRSPRIQAIAEHLVGGVRVVADAHVIQAILAEAQEPR